MSVCAPGRELLNLPLLKPFSGCCTSPSGGCEKLEERICQKGIGRGKQYFQYSTFALEDLELLHKLGLDNPNSLSQFSQQRDSIPLILFLCSSGFTLTGPCPLYFGGSRAEHSTPGGVSREQKEQHWYLHLQSQSIKQKMSDSHSVKFNILKRNSLTSPSSNFRNSSFKDMCCTSAFLDRRYNESVKNPDAEHKETPRVTSISLLQGHSERSDPNAFIPVSSSIEKEFNSISLSEKREANRSADYFESPKSSRKGFLLPRRLILPKTVEADTTVECCERLASSSRSIRKKIFSCVLNSEEKLPKFAADSPKDKSYKPLTTGISKPEDCNPDSQKWRSSFSQQRTSTLDESQGKEPLLLESESLSPIQCKDVIVNNTNEFSGSVLVRVNDGELRTVTCNVLPEASEGKFLTSINSPVENLNFGLCDINSPPVKVANYPDLSTPEDSGYNSLPLDKSGDSSSDHEGSFQELFQKHKEDSKILDNKRKTRKLERVRRLSTLREHGSQSETEDNHGSPTSTHILTEERNLVREDHEIVLKEQPSGELVVSHGDFSRTPALKIVQEICLQRQRLDQKQISDNIDGTGIFALDHVLPGLIGKKMGLEKLDILTELKERNLKHVLAIVLNALTVESLCNICKVSKNWREIVVQDKSADKRRKLYIKQLKEEAGVPEEKQPCQIRKGLLESDTKLLCQFSSGSILELGRILSLDHVGDLFPIALLFT
ncbi:F-box only protein 43 [Willisornis vidua]|uniref:F-box only protein 43 n=1 Tax=Willisornis vidua TaxID=1566151 RepID=A0ABQ9D6F2_9PASS|nr:F-box only protein 43 [Willisornis vidua]